MLININYLYLYYLKLLKKNIFNNNIIKYQKKLNFFNKN